ncbi:MAG: PD-(D/E)XK nuclease family transposase [Treponema sp.]|nr:PD-(D/E)XK nuclease family transposase [Treponema sp.]
MAQTIFDNINPAVMERIKNLRLIDDELMTVVFSGDKEATELLIRILLNRNDLRVTKSMTQAQKHNLFGRSVTLDIVAEDIFKTEYNIEIQRADKGAGAKRIRYHQAMLDSHSLKKKKDFEDLPNLYIIFILEHDLFGKNEPIYFVSKILNIKDEDGKYLPFDDGCNIMYVNGEYRGDDALGKLMHDFSTPNADEMNYNRLAEKVRFYKQDETGVQNMCKIVEEYGDERAAEALKQGIQQGEQKKAIEDAVNLLKTNLLTPEQIAQTIKLPLQKVLELQKQIN